MALGAPLLYAGVVLLGILLIFLRTLAMEMHVHRLGVD